MKIDVDVNLPFRCPNCNNDSPILFRRINEKWYAVCTAFPHQRLHSKKVFGEQEVDYLNEVADDQKRIEEERVDIIDLFTSSDPSTEISEDEVGLLRLYDNTKRQS